MGYRAHVVTQEREYGSSIFYDFEQFEDYYYKLCDIYDDNCPFLSESRELFEIDRDVVKQEIERLTELGVDNEFEFQNYYNNGDKETNGDIITAWKDALSESPSSNNIITMEWF